MASAFDVAAYILEKCGPITAMKLQKLVYYSQAWSLVWDESPMFDENIEAWANGPVVRELYHAHRGNYMVDNSPQGDSSQLTTDQKETIESVLSYYAQFDGQWLSDLTHMESPWKDARAGIPDTERSAIPIPLDSMMEYYSSLRPDS
ncbi:MAG: DUF4065 domain-containing protein [Gammaproteobacteria bacterium]|nr:DUF4065 domain-containing protein [Gammaproteobacteria bacterium]